jgi:hypothetical protein
MPNEIDEIMNTDPLQLSKADRSKLIEYHRVYRDKIERGVKPKKVLEAGPRLEIKPILPRPTFKRRV